MNKGAIGKSGWRTAARPAAALTEQNFRRAVAKLSARDQRLAAVIAQWGTPPFWVHPDGFSGLVLTILAQQVSLESAQAAFRKLEQTLHRITPAAFLGLDAAALRMIGFSRQKAGYATALAGAMVAGELDLAALAKLNDAAAHERLRQIRGLGKWSADVYLLFSLRRPDVWPSGDLALEIAVSELWGAAARLDSTTVDRLALEWRPFRAVAARILWHHYLSRRGRAEVATANAPRDSVITCQPTASAI